MLFGEAVEFLGRWSLAGRSMSLMAGFEGLWPLCSFCVFHVCIWRYELSGFGSHDRASSLLPSHTLPFVSALWPCVLSQQQKSNQYRQFWFNTSCFSPPPPGFSRILLPSSDKGTSLPLPPPSLVVYLADFCGWPLATETVGDLASPVFSTI